MPNAEYRKQWHTSFENVNQEHNVQAKTWKMQTSRLLTVVEGLVRQDIIMMTPNRLGINDIV